MQPTQPMLGQDERSHLIGVLCVGGDWACAHGDFETVGHLTRRLAGLVGEPIHCELTALAEVCTTDPRRAVDAWTEAKILVGESNPGLTLTLDADA